VWIESPFDDERGALHFEPESEFTYTCPHLSGYERAVLLQAAAAAKVASEELTAGELGGSRRRELEQLVEQGIRAKNKLVAAYLWQAEYYARSVAKTRRGSRHEIRDLMQEALLGLLWTIDHFDPQSGVGFDNLAGPVMHGAARRSVARRRPRTAEGDSAPA
jgi:RNA polymerase primary sigma factor